MILTQVKSKNKKKTEEKQRWYALKETFPTLWGGPIRFTEEAINVLNITTDTPISGAHSTVPGSKVVVK